MAHDVPLLDKTTGDPVDWPVGTTAWLEISSSTFSEEYPALVQDNLLRWSIPGSETSTWPKYACASIWIQYPDQPSPIVWAEGKTERGCC